MCCELILIQNTLWPQDDDSMMQRTQMPPFEEISHSTAWRPVMGAMAAMVGMAGMAEMAAMAAMDVMAATAAMAAMAAMVLMATMAAMAAVLSSTGIRNYSN
jgi:hypothetical protein